MNTINLPPLGELTCTQPALVLCYDLLSEWGESPSRPKIGRLCAAAIGLSTQSHHTGLPVYKISSLDLVGYGNRCLDRLLQKGVTAGSVVTQGMLLVQQMAEALPQDQEVEATVNFTESGQQADGTD
jgi:hypothetical protein